MSNHRFRLLTVALIGLLGLSLPHASAQTTVYYFSPDGIAPEGYGWNLDPLTYDGDLDIFLGLWSVAGTTVPWENDFTNHEARFSANPPDRLPTSIGPVPIEVAIEVNTIRFEDNSWSLTSGGGSLKVASIEVATGASASISANISNSGAALAKTGGGTLTLSGSNSYGTLTVTAGALKLDAVAALPTASPVVLNGGTLQIGVTGTIGTTGSTNTLTLDASSTLDFGSGLGATTISFSDSSGIGWAGATLTILNYNSANDQLRFGTDNGGLTGTQLGKLSFSGYTGTPALDVNGFVTGLVAVPEPSTYAAITGVLALGVAAIRRRRKSEGSGK